LISTHETQVAYLVAFITLFLILRERRRRALLARARTFILKNQIKMLSTSFNRNVKKNVRKVKPDLIVYNAGTDILEGDPLGILAITPMVKRLLHDKIK
jgi:hypothetical protein